MKLSEFLNKHNAYEKFIKNFDKEFYEMRNKRNEHSISSAFLWTTVPEDAEFWNALNKEWHELDQTCENDMTWLAIPNSKSDKSKFTKEDSGKTMMSLIEPKFVIGVSDTLTMGATKYSIDNWKLCEDPRRYKDALLRHIYAYMDGQETDPESGLSHLYHAGFNLMALDYFDRNEQMETK